MVIATLRLIDTSIRPTDRLPVYPICSGGGPPLGRPSIG
jgi:hypothetical protein